jgi:penicillin amidase
VARPAHQRAAARRLAGDARDHAALAARSGQRARRLVRAVLRARRRATARRAAAGRDAARLAEAGRLLGAWDRRYVPDDRRAVLFEWAMRELTLRAWDELAAPVGATRDPFGEPSRGARLAPTPAVATLARLLADSTSAWWDERATRDRVETRDDVLARALVAALDTCVRRYGAPDADGWLWRNRRHANVHHLLRLPAFSSLGLPVQGGPSTLSPSSGTGVHGASWRMVVELGPEVRAWGTYPGGQSGDPTSPGYRDRLASWQAGELEPLLFAPRRPEQVTPSRGAYTLVPAGAPARGGR